MGYLLVYIKMETSQWRSLSLTRGASDTMGGSNVAKKKNYGTSNSKQWRGNNRPCGGGGGISLVLVGVFSF